MIATREPMELKEIIEESEYGSCRYFVCPACEYGFDEEERSYFENGSFDNGMKYIPKFCPNCGQALKPIEDLCYNKYKNREGDSI